MGGPSCRTRVRTTTGILVPNYPPGTFFKRIDKF